MSWAAADTAHISGRASTSMAIEQRIVPPKRRGHGSSDGATTKVVD
jgi:hypothetical protein